MEDFLKFKVKRYRGVDFIDVYFKEWAEEREIGELTLWEDRFSFCFTDGCGVGRVYVGIFPEEFDLRRVEWEKFADYMRERTGLDFEYVSFRRGPGEIIGVDEIRVSNKFEFYETIIFGDLIRTRSAITNKY